MARRTIEQTLHTGEVAYLHAKGLIELDFPVLVRPMNERYNYVVARAPVQDYAELFHRVWQPSDAMQEIAGKAFGEWYTEFPQQLEEESIIWEAVRRIHQYASLTRPETMQQANQVVGRVASYLTEHSGVAVPAVSFAVSAEIARWLGALALPHHMTASVAAATLLLMLGVPVDRVALFGIYFQDPTVYFQPTSDWRAGFMSGTPYYTVMGIFLKGRWIPLDFTLLASGPHHRLQNQPHAHVRHSSLGKHPADGVPLVIDFAHPYTMVFAPPPPNTSIHSALLTRIPMLRMFGL